MGYLFSLMEFLGLQLERLVCLPTLLPKLRSWPSNNSTVTPTPAACRDMLVRPRPRPLGSRLTLLLKLLSLVGRHSLPTEESWELLVTSDPPDFVDLLAVLPSGDKMCNLL